MHRGHRLQPEQQIEENARRDPMREPQRHAWFRSTHGKLPKDGIVSDAEEAAVDEVPAETQKPSDIARASGDQATEQHFESKGRPSGPEPHAH